MATGEMSEFADLKEMLNQLCLEEKSKIERMDTEPRTRIHEIPGSRGINNVQIPIYLGQQDPEPVDMASVERTADVPATPDWNVDQIPIYLEGPGPGPVQTVFVEPTGIDCSLLRQPHADPTLDIASIVRQPPDCEEADADSWVESELKPLLAGVAEDAQMASPAASESMQRYKRLITDIVRYNSTGTALRMTRAVPVAPGVEEEHVRLRLMTLWAERARTKTGKELLQSEKLLRELRLVDPKSCPDNDVEGDIRKCERHIRRLNQELWIQCSNATLKELAREMQEDEEKQVDEIIELQAIREVDEVTLNTMPGRNQDLLSTAVGNQTALVETVEGQMSVLMPEIEALENLIALTTNRMRKVQTRVGRVTARDVRDPEEREKEVKRRLEHPEALDFMLRARDDVWSTRTTSEAMRRHAAAVDAGLDRIYGAAVDAYGTNRDALIDMGLRTGDEGIGRDCRM